MTTTPMTALIYDPPSGWRYGFPRFYRPQEGESLADTLLRDGYPQKEIDNDGAKYCRFFEAPQGEPKDEPQEETP